MQEKTKLLEQIKQKRKIIKRKRELNRNKNVQSVLPIREFGEGYIKTETDTFYFIGEYPKNAKLMTKSENIAHKQKMAKLYNNFEIITKFSTDLPYSLDENKKYLTTQKGQHDERNELLDNMNNTLDIVEEKNENSIKRFYYVFKQSDNIDIGIVKSHFYDNDVKYFIPSKTELEQMFRSYVLVDDNVNDVMYYGFDEYIDTFLPVQIKPYPDILFMGGKYRKVIFAKNYPNPLTEFYLSKLSTFKGVNVTIKAVEKKSNIMVDEIVKSKIKNGMLKNEGSVKKQVIAGYEDRNIDGLYDYMQDSQQKMFDVSLFIEVVADTREEVTKKIERVKTGLKSITVDSLNDSTMNLFKSVNPLYDRPMPFIKRNMPSESLSCLNNANYSGRLKPHGVFLGTDESGGLIFVDFYERTEDITNGHFVIAADSGQGKSYLAKKILYQNYALNIRIISMDNDREYNTIVNNTNNTNIDVLRSEYIVNPLEIKLFGSFDDIDNEDDDERRIYQNYKTFNATDFLRQHLGWLRDFFRMQDDELTNEHLNILEYLLIQFYAYWGITSATNLNAYKPTDYPTFSDLFTYLQAVEKKMKHDDRLMQAISKEKMDKILLSINVLANGSLAPLFNGHTKIKGDDWLNFILQDLLEKNKVQQDLFFFNILGYIWSEQVKYKIPTILFTDELYLVINKDKPIVLDYYKMFVKRGRKYELIVGSATQNLNDFRHPDILTMTQPLFSVPKHKFIGFPGENELDLLKPMLNLTQGEIDTISVSQKRHFLLMAGKDKYKLVVAGAPEEGSDQEDKFSLMYERDLFGKAGGR